MFVFVVFYLKYFNIKANLIYLAWFQEPNILSYLLDDLLQGMLTIQTMVRAKWMVPLFKVDQMMRFENLWSDF